MPSIIDVCNKALDKVGQNPITSLGDGGKAANACNRNWPLVRDTVLRDHPWNFAMAREVLAPSTVAPAWGFTAKFPIPSDFLRLIEIRDLSTNEYQLENGHIHANATALYIRYIKRVTDPNVYDSLFVEAVSTRLAAEMCETFTQSTSKKRALFEEYGENLIRAKSVDGQENPPSTYEEDEWIEARY